MFFSWDDDLVEVALEDEEGNKESVFHRRYISRKDRTVAREAGLQIKVVLSGATSPDTAKDAERAKEPAANGATPKEAATTVTTFNIDAAQNAMLGRMIVRWSFRYPDGNAVPINAETIGQLRDTVSKQIVDSINELNKPVAASGPLEVLSPPQSVAAATETEPSED